MNLHQIVKDLVRNFPCPLYNFPSMFYAYIIKCIFHDYFYKGHCEDLEARLKQHNQGATVSIKPFIPFEIVYFEEFSTLDEAIKREKYFKSSAGRRFLKEKLGKP